MPVLRSEHGLLQRRRDLRRGQQLPVQPGAERAHRCLAVAEVDRRGLLESRFGHSGGNAGLAVGIENGGPDEKQHGHERSGQHADSLLPGPAPPPGAVKQPVPESPAAAARPAAPRSTASAATVTAAITAAAAAAARPGLALGAGSVPQALGPVPQPRAAISSGKAGVAGIVVASAIFAGTVIAAPVVTSTAAVRAVVADTVAAGAAAAGSPRSGTIGSGTVGKGTVVSRPASRQVSRFVAPVSPRPPAARAQAEPLAQFLRRLGRAAPRSRTAPDRTGVAAAPPEPIPPAARTRWRRGRGSAAAAAIPARTRRGSPRRPPAALARAALRSVALPHIFPARAGKMCAAVWGTASRTPAWGVVVAGEIHVPIATASVAAASSSRILPVWPGILWITHASSLVRVERSQSSGQSPGFGFPTLPGSTYRPGMFTSHTPNAVSHCRASLVDR